MANTKKQQIYALLLLTLAVLIWGTSFAAQTDSTQYIGPLTLIAARSYVGAAALSVVMLIKRFIKSKNASPDGLSQDDSQDIKEKQPSRTRRILAGIVCGVAIAGASGLQQGGIYYNTAVISTDSTGKAGFLTALYIIFVPIFGLFFKKKLSPKIIIGLVLGVVGIYMLCVTSSSGISLGDIMLIGCGLMYAVHILTIDILGKNIDPVELSFYQFLTAAVVLSVIAFITERDIPFVFEKAIFPILYLGILSSAVGFTAQIYAQQYLHPAVASLVMCFESVVAAISGAVFLKEAMSARQIIACVILFFGIMIAQFGNIASDFLKKILSAKRMRR